jgi:hypothetical protein
MRDGMVRGAKGASRNEGGAVASEAGDAVHAGDVDGPWLDHLRQDGGELAHGHHGEDLMLLGKR